jgi:putative SOS response-associated peptidase YedK
MHNRMPVILRQEDEEQWLDAARTTFAKAKSLLKPLPAELMNAHDCSRRFTNRQRSEVRRAGVIRPVSDDDTPRAGQLSLL